MNLKSRDFAFAWLEGRPFSARFGDVYFSRDGGLQETLSVFVDGNALLERFRALHASSFTIAELGFGTGLNFLCAWQVFAAHAPATARLHFISFELYPLTNEELRAALAMFPAIKKEADTLLEQYEQLPHGWHRLEFDDARVCLTLVIGDARDNVSQMSSHADAWFLDGFSPAKNPELWSAEIFRAISSRSSIGTTFATYSAAGHVRRALEEAGFSVERRKGFASKREMLRGACKRPQPLPYSAPWHRLPAFKDKPQSAIVVGAGLAGTTVAHRLAARGIRVTLFERHGTLASEASGNAQAMLYFKPSPHGTCLTDIAISGYGYVRRALRLLNLDSHAWSECGVMQMGFDEAERKRQLMWQTVLTVPEWGRVVDRDEASRIAGVQVDFDALWVANGGWVQPASLCEAWVRQECIEVRLGVTVTTIKRGTHRRWCVFDQSGAGTEADIVVLANANAVKSFAQAERLPLRAIRGQLTQLPANATSAQLKTVLCADGYVAPENGGAHCVGATFGLNDASTQVSIEDHEENLQTLARLSQELRSSFGDIDVSRLSGRAGLRCVSPDYLPLIGPLMDAQQFDLRYARLAKDAGEHFEDATPPWLDHLYVSTGHGSRGAITAPIAAETIAAIATQEPVPLAKRTLESVLPPRFLARSLARRTPKSAPRRTTAKTMGDATIKS